VPQRQGIAAILELEQMDDHELEERLGTPPLAPAHVLDLLGHELPVDLLVRTHRRERAQAPGLIERPGMKVLVM
jgi:hypothetical protein